MITHASTEKARFLNYHIVNQQCDTKQTKKRRIANGRIGLLVPPDVVESKCALYQRAGKSHHRPELLENDDFTIINMVPARIPGSGAILRACPQRLLVWETALGSEVSLLKTLACKHQSGTKASCVNTRQAPGSKRNNIQMPGNPSPTRGEEAPCGPIWRHTASTATNGSPGRATPQCYGRTERNELVKRLLAENVNLWITGKRRSTSHPQARRSRKRGKRATTLGPDHGSPPKKDPCSLPPLSPGYPHWTAYTTEGIGMNDWRAVCAETGTYSSVGGQWKRANSVPRQRPTQLGALGNSASACL